MDMSRRIWLKASIAASLARPLGALALSPPAEKTIRINIPGPQALPFLPIELIPTLGLDREAGGRLLVRYQPSGVRGMEDMLAGNADFAGLGFSTLPVMHAKGQDVVAIAALAGRTPPIGLVVRKDLAKNLRRIADLKGYSIATSVGSINSKTYLQMVAEALLKSHGVPHRQIRWVPAAQNWDSVSGAMLSKAADAVLCEQPLADRLVREGVGAMLTDMEMPEAQARIPGYDHLRSTVATSRTLTRTRPEKARLMLDMLKRSLAWIRVSPPELIAEKVDGLSADERQDIAAILRRYPGLFSPDARFVAAQIENTDLFLRSTAVETDLVPAASLIDDQWAGRKQP